MPVDGILLDHDMRHRDGREWARWFDDPDGWTNIPVIITSTTGLEGVREEMLETLQKAGFKAVINPASRRSLSCQSVLMRWNGMCEFAPYSVRPLKLRYVCGVEIQLPSAASMYVGCHV